MTGQRRIHKDDGRNARRTLDAADRMLGRVEEMRVKAFRKLFGDAKLAETTDRAGFANMFRAAEAYGKVGRHIEAGAIFVSLSGMIKDKKAAGKLAWRGAVEHLKAGGIEAAYRAFSYAMGSMPEEKDKMARNAAERFIALSKKAETGGKPADAARALGCAAGMLKNVGSERAQALLVKEGELYFAAGDFGNALGAFLDAIACNTNGGMKVVKEMVPLFVGKFIEKAKELEGYHVMKLGEAAHVYSLAAELNGKISPEMAYPLYMEARRLYIVVGDTFKTADMCSKAADSIAEKDPAEAARLKVEAGELYFGPGGDGIAHIAADRFASAAKLLEQINPAASLDLHIKAGGIYATAENPREDEVERFFVQAKAEYDAAVELAKRVDGGRLLDLQVKMSILYNRAKEAGEPLE